MINVNDKDLGRATAYAYAVSKGYTGTEEEFAQLMANYATVGQTATEAAERAASSAEASGVNSLKSEGYSVGKQNGEDVEEGSPYYHNNAKYYSEQSAASAATSAAMTGLAPAFSTSKAYAAGDYVLYNGTLYRFTAAHAAGAWTGSDATAVTLGPDVADLKSALNYIEYGKIQKLDTFSLPYGDFALNNNISNLRATNYRVAYTKLISMDVGDSFVFQSNGVYNIAFAKFDNTGKCTKAPLRWLNDGNYSYSDIMAEIGSNVDSPFSFQLKLADGTSIYPNAVSSTAFCSLISDIPISIENDSITEEKLSPEVREKLNTITPASENLLQDIPLIAGAYSVGDDLETPSTGTNRSRLAYSIGFALDNNMVFSANTNGAYNIAFCGFDNSGKCISTPTVWLNDGVYTAQDIMANAKSTSAAKYTFQIKELNGGIISDTISATDYYSLETVEINKIVDVIMFMGQSNMAGRGEVANAPMIIDGAGYEYRAISAPNTLTPMAEPFGATESNPSGINEGSSKTGSMVVAFTNAYYLHNGNIPVVGISASKGGTAISEWQSGGAYLTDAISRLSSCVTYLTNNGYTIRHKYILWCQGETDGDNSTTAQEYKSLFDAMLASMKAVGIEKLFMVRIGNYNSGSSTKYDTIMDCQTSIAQTEPDVIMASTDFAGMRERGLMKDAWHYYQAAYNEVGKYSGINVAIYEQTGKEPTMYDTKDGTLYYTHKN